MKHTPAVHSVQTLVLELNATSDTGAATHDAKQWERRLSRYCQQTLAGVLQPCFDEAASDTSVVQVRRLELDLGQIRADQFETQLSARLTMALRDALRRLGLPRPVGAPLEPIAWSPAKPSNVPAAWPALLRYLQLNALPAAISPGELIAQAMDAAPAELAVALRDIGLTQALGQRLATVLNDPQRENLVAVLQAREADMIIRYARQLRQAQRARTWLPTDSHGFGVAIWTFIFDFLLESRSMFDQRRLVDSTLRRIASRYRLDFGVLIGHLSRDIDRLVTHAGRASELLLILRELRQGTKVAVPIVAERATVPGDLTIVAACDYMLAALSVWLRQGYRRGALLRDTPEQGFVWLARQHAQTWRAILPDQLRLPAARRRLLRSLSPTGRRCLFGVLLPSQTQAFDRGLLQLATDLGLPPSDGALAEAALAWWVDKRPARLPAGWLAEVLRQYAATQGLSFADLASQLACLGRAALQDTAAISLDTITVLAAWLATETREIMLARMLRRAMHQAPDALVALLRMQPIAARQLAQLAQLAQALSTDGFVRLLALLTSEVPPSAANREGQLAQALMANTLTPERCLLLYLQYGIWRPAAPHQRLEDWLQGFADEALIAAARQAGPASAARIAPIAPGWRERLFRLLAGEQWPTVVGLRERVATATWPAEAGLVADRHLLGRFLAALEVSIPALAEVLTMQLLLDYPAVAATLGLALPPPLLLEWQVELAHFRRHGVFIDPSVMTALAIYSVSPPAAWLYSSGVAARPHPLLAGRRRPAMRNLARPVWWPMPAERLPVDTHVGRLMEFLRSDSVPWWADDHAMAPQHTFRTLLAQHPAALLAALRPAMGQPGVLSRLLRYLPEAVLRRLVMAISPGQGGFVLTWLQAGAALAHSPALSGSQRRRSARLHWETALQLLLRPQGDAMSAARFLEEAGQQMAHRWVLPEQQYAQLLGQAALQGTQRSQRYGALVELLGAVSALAVAPLPAEAWAWPDKGLSQARHHRRAGLAGARQIIAVWLPHAAGCAQRMVCPRGGGSRPAMAQQAEPGDCGAAHASAAGRFVATGAVGQAIADLAVAGCHR